MIPKKAILETIDGCNDIIDYLLTTDSVEFKTHTGTTVSKDKKLIQCLLNYFKSVRTKFKTKL